MSREALSSPELPEGPALVVVVWFGVRLPSLPLLWFVVNVGRRSWVFFVWILVHHLQLGLDGADFCARTKERTEGKKNTYIDMRSGKTSVAANGWEMERVMDRSVLRLKRERRALPSIRTDGEREKGRTEERLQVPRHESHYLNGGTGWRGNWGERSQSVRVTERTSVHVNDRAGTLGGKARGECLHFPLVCQCDVYTRIKVFGFSPRSSSSARDAGSVL